MPYFPFNLCGATIFGTPETPGFNRNGGSGTAHAVAELPDFKFPLTPTPINTPV